ncbi:MAG: CARDB domain-containing protein [Candidatus Hodarchaeota archaeon]
MNRKKQIPIISLLIVISVSISLITIGNIQYKQDNLINACCYNKKTLQVSQSSADFLLTTNIPEYMDYQETLLIDIEIKEISNKSHNSISIKLEMDPGLNFAVGQSDEIDLGTFVSEQIKTVNFSITASQTFLTNPYILMRLYLYKNGVQQFIQTPDSEDPLSYAAYGITISYPLLKVDGPIELKGFVVPRVDLAPNEVRKLTYNISNSGGSDLKNISFRIEVNQEIVEISSLSHTSLDELKAKEYILVDFTVTSKIMTASNSRLYFYVDSTFYEEREYSIKIKTFDWFNPYKYYNVMVLIAWPIFIIVFIAFALFIIKYSWNKHIKREKIAKLLEERYGKSIID